MRTGASHVQQVGGCASQPPPDDELQHHRAVEHVQRQVRPNASLFLLREGKLSNTEPMFIASSSASFAVKSIWDDKDAGT